MEANVTSYIISLFSLMETKIDFFIHGFKLLTMNIHLRKMKRKEKKRIENNLSFFPEVSASAHYS